MNTQGAIAIDFETHSIEPRPDFPPKPVGVSVLWPNKRPRYLHWGHEAGEANSTQAEVKRELRRAIESGRPLVFHNSLFDVPVAETLGVRIPWDRVRDTQIYHFIVDPFAQTGALKPTAEQWLGMEPEEQDDLKEWIFANVPGARRKKSQWGAHIWRAPGRLVGRYANGDTVRTRKLLLRFDRELDGPMREAVEREHKLLPIIAEMERRGVPIDRPSLKRDHSKWRYAVEQADAWIRKRLGVPDLDVGKSRELADAIEHAGIVDEWILTTKGDRSTSYGNLRVLRDEGLLHDDFLPEVVAYRVLMAHACGTFVKPWLNMSEADGVHIYCNWNAVRQDRSVEGRKTFGARTGRLSSNPNFQNITKIPQTLVGTKTAKEKALAAEQRVIHLPGALHRALPPLPNLRWYVKAQKGARFVGGDFAQQELRILAHFLADPTLHARYLADPSLNFHRLAMALIREVAALDVSYQQIKPVDFGIIYGAGAGRIAEQIETTVETAMQIRRAWKRALPVSKLERDFQLKEHRHEPYFTIGGRRYFVEKGFAYKALNYIIQGSAADEMKESMIRFDDWRQSESITLDEARLVLSVHDEPVTLVRDVDPKRIAAGLMEAMVSTGSEGPVPMLSIPMRADSYVRQRWGKAA